jgi:hypothetical protein
MRKERTVTHAKRRASPSRVVLVVFLALLCPAGRIIASLHEATVRHVICAEHGELAHLSSNGPEAGATPPSKAPAARGQNTSVDHEHCQQAGVLTRQASTVVLKEAAAPAMVVRAGLGEPARYIAPGTRLLLSAPKTSPPRA